MTIDEAIERLKYDREIDMDINELAPQIAEWLEELKAFRENKWTDTYIKRGYNKAIDDFVKEICKMIVQSENNGNYRFYAVEIKQSIADLAEQLKAGKDNANKN